MGARRQFPPPSENVVMSFCAVLVTTKRSDKLFIHHLHNQSSAWLLGFRPKTPTGDPSWTPLGGPRTLICPPLKKNSAGTHSLTLHSGMERGKQNCRYVNLSLPLSVPFFLLHLPPFSQIQLSSQWKRCRPKHPPQRFGRSPADKRFLLHSELKMMLMLQ